MTLYWHFAADRTVRSHLVVVSAPSPTKARLPFCPNAIERRFCRIEDFRRIGLYG